jgi:hypothetical protein
MKLTLAGLALVIFVLLGVPAVAADTLSLYDNFGGNNLLIDSTKWTGTADDALELKRYIAYQGSNPALYLFARLRISDE